MNIHVIYTESEIILSKKQYESWHEIQDEYPDYKASFSSWTIKEIEEFLADEYLDIYPSASVQVRSFIHSPNVIHIVTFENLSVNDPK